MLALLEKRRSSLNSTIFLRLFILWALWTLGIADEGCFSSLSLKRVRRYSRMKYYVGANGVKTLEALVSYEILKYVLYQISANC